MKFVLENKKKELARDTLRTSNVWGRYSKKKIMRESCLGFEGSDGQKTRVPFERFHLTLANRCSKCPSE